MGEGSEVAARSDRSLLGNDGQDVALDEGDEEVERGFADAAIAAREHVGPQDHQRPRRFRRKRRADARGVGEDEVALQALQVGTGDRDLGEGPEAGVDPVGRNLALRDAVDELARGAYPLARLRGDLDAGPARRRPCDLLEREGPSVEDDAHAAALLAERSLARKRELAPAI